MVLRLPVQSGVNNSLPWNLPSIFERKFSHQPIINLMSGLRQNQIPTMDGPSDWFGKVEIWASEYSYFDCYILYAVVLPDSGIL
jgi:hypothetical protein